MGCSCIAAKIRIQQIATCLSATGFARHRNGLLIYGKNISSFCDPDATGIKSIDPDRSNFLE